MSEPSSQEPKPLWVETPLIYSTHLSSLLSADIYLKLEAFQPSQSFKYRGVSHFIQRAFQKHGAALHIVIASSGNAGLAATCAAKVLGVLCTVFLPTDVSAPTMSFLRRQGAELVVHGSSYLEASQNANASLARDANAVMVPAYDNPLLWEGHASMVLEIALQLPADTKPDAIFCSVGGGGLAGGVMTGCAAVGWDDVPLIALETTGSNCFYQSLGVNIGPFVREPSVPQSGMRIEHDNEHDVNVAHLNALTSRAASLGASSPSPGVVKMALKRSGGVKSVCVPDELAMYAARAFADDHKMLTELACSTTLTAAYQPALFDRLVPQRADGARRIAVFIVCGGFKISLQEVEEDRKLLESALREGGNWEVLCNGEQWNIPK